MQEYNVPQASSLPTLATLSTEYLRGPDLGGGVGGMVCSIRDGEKIYSHSNHRGDVIARTDGTGSLTWYAVYEAYGTRPFEWSDGTTGNPDRQMANTKDEEAELGLLNEGMRYRDLETGTFLTRDPIRYADGPNMYCYVHCNPITSFDPLGLYDQDDIDERQEELDLLRISEEKKYKKQYDECDESLIGQWKKGNIIGAWNRRQKELDQSQAEIYEMQKELNKCRWGDTDIPDDRIDTMFVDYNGVPQVGIYKGGILYHQDASENEIARFLKKDSLGRWVVKSVDEINAYYTQPIAETCGTIDKYMTPAMKAAAYTPFIVEAFAAKTMAAVSGGTTYLTHCAVSGQKPSVEMFAASVSAGFVPGGNKTIDMLKGAITTGIATGLGTRAESQSKD